MAAGASKAVQAAGLQPMQPECLFCIFAEVGYALQPVVAGLDLQRFCAVNTAKGQWTFLDDLCSLPASSPTAVVPRVVARMSPIVQLLRKVAATKPSLLQSRDDVAELIELLATELLGKNIGTGDQSLAGEFDSFSAVEMSSRLSQSLNISLPSTLVYNYPSIRSMACHVHDLLALGPVKSFASSPAYTLQPASATALKSDFNPMCIFLASRLPGSNNILLNCPRAELIQDVVQTVPLDRWDADSLHVNKEVLDVRWGGWLKGVADFEANIFGVSRAESERMDPQQRQLLETTLEVLQVGRPNLAECKASRLLYPT